MQLAESAMSCLWHQAKLAAYGMEKMGGSFVKLLGQMLIRADEQNLCKLYSTFPEYWRKYVELGIEIKQREGSFETSEQLKEAQEAANFPLEVLPIKQVFSVNYQAQSWRAFCLLMTDKIANRIHQKIFELAHGRGRDMAALFLVPPGLSQITEWSQRSEKEFDYLFASPFEPDYDEPLKENLIVPWVITYPFPKSPYYGAIEIRLLFSPEREYTVTLIETAGEKEQEDA